MGDRAANLLRRHRGLAIRCAVAVHDAFMGGACFIAATLVTTPGPTASRTILVGTIGVLALITATSPLIGLNRGIWRYASVGEFLRIAQLTALVAITLLAAIGLGSLSVSPAAALVFAAFMGVSLGATRIAYRAIRERGCLTADSAQLNRVILVGIGETSDSIIRHARSSNRQVIGLIDDHGRRRGLTMLGAPVLGDLTELPQVLERLAHKKSLPDQLILSKPSNRFSIDALQSIVDAVGAFGIEILQQPTFAETSRQFGRPAEPQPLRLADLLERNEVGFQDRSPEPIIRDRRILVTGAGGSIGSEICSQIAGLRPAELLLVDISEQNLTSIMRRIDRTTDGRVRASGKLLDVRDATRTHAVFREFRPDIVIHAAALKHVPVTENHPLEAAATNVLGTRHVFDAAVETGAYGAVLISTDKVVDPTTILGATKRMAELYVQSLDAATSTKCTTVRFGNVLGSSGSVVEVFKEQIEDGGPLTVSHPEATRYLMSIAEASCLVLHSIALSKSSNNKVGDIYVLDMGRPIRIVDLARRMIILSNKVPNRDVKIVFTGLRGPEKLSEKLFFDAEEVRHTAHKSIRAAHTEPMQLEVLCSILRQIDMAVSMNNASLLRRTLTHAIPTCHLAPPSTPSAITAT